MKHLPATAMRSNGADYSVARHFVRIDPDVPLEDILRPSFWVHQARFLRRDDEVRVISDTLEVRMTVVSVGVGFAQMRPTFVWVDENAQKAGVAKADTPEQAKDLPALPGNYEIKKGPGGRWRVFTKEPRMEIKGGFLKEEEAIQHAIDHSTLANAA